MRRLLRPGRLEFLFRHSSLSSLFHAQTNQCEQFLGVPSESNASSMYVVFLLLVFFASFLHRSAQRCRSFSLTLSYSLDGIRQICGFGSALLGGVAASQTSAGLSYTYNGVPSQGYPTTTSIGVGGVDYGSAEGAASTAATVRAGLVVVFSAVLGGVLVVLYGV
jgi:hypothetical protein